MQVLIVLLFAMVVYLVLADGSFRIWRVLVQYSRQARNTLATAKEDWEDATAEVQDEIRRETDRVDDQMNKTTDAH